MNLIKKIVFLFFCLCTLSWGKININSASDAELMNLSGIGEVKAESIIKYRKTYGRFDSIEDIKRVKGVGPKLYEKIKNDITVSTELENNKNLKTKKPRKVRKAVHSSE